MSSSSSDERPRHKKLVPVKPPAPVAPVIKPVPKKKVDQKTPVKAIQFTTEKFHPDPDHGLDSDTSGSDSRKKVVGKKVVPVKAEPVVNLASSSGRPSLRKSLPAEDDPMYVTKGEKLVITSKDYLVKLEDTIIVINSSGPVKIKLLAVSGQGTSHVSKKIIIKAVGSPTVTHTVECGKDNYFDFDNTRSTVSLNGREVIRLQAAGKSWIIV
jgi:hypothetical protein